MLPNKTDKKIFWDYDLSRIDLSQPKIKDWFMTRKLQFGSLRGLSKKDLKKHLPKLEINPFLKEMLQNYLKTNTK